MKRIKKEVTIIIPTHKGRQPERFIKKVNKKLTEIIIINDTHLKGPSWARNKGLRKSKTKYVIFLDSDVFISQNIIDYMKEVLEKDKNIDIVFPYIEFEDGVPYFPANRYSNPSYPGLGACFMCRREKLIENNLYFDELYILNYEETDFFIRCEHKGLKAKYLPDLRVIHEIKDGGVHFILDEKRYYLEFRNYLYARWKLKKLLKKTSVQHALSFNYILLFLYRLLFKTTRFKRFKVKSLIKSFSFWYLLKLYFKGYKEFLQMRKKSEKIQ